MKDIIANLTSDEWFEVEKVKNFAIKAHRATNHCYGKYPYEFHLFMVCNQVLEYKHLLSQDDFILALKAAFLHDVIEDARVTYNDIKKKFGIPVAEIVYALTNNKGRNRDERADDSYYNGIRTNPLFIFVKLCDRLANIKFSKYGEYSFTNSPLQSKSKPSSMYYKYKKENVNFTEKLQVPDIFRIMEEDTFRLLDIH